MIRAHHPDHDSRSCAFGTRRIAFGRDLVPSALRKSPPAWFSYLRQSIEYRWNTSRNAPHSVIPRERSESRDLLLRFTRRLRPLSSSLFHHSAFIFHLSKGREGVFFSLAPFPPAVGDAVVSSLFTPYSSLLPPLPSVSWPDRKI